MILNALVFFSLCCAQTYVKLNVFFLAGKISRSCAWFSKRENSISNQPIESENDDKSDQNSIESGSKSINETNEAKIAEFLLENQLKRERRKNNLRKVWVKYWKILKMYKVPLSKLFNQLFHLSDLTFFHKSIKIKTFDFLFRSFFMQRVLPPLTPIGCVRTFKLSQHHISIVKDILAISSNQATLNWSIFQLDLTSHQHHHHLQFAMWPKRHSS